MVESTALEMRRAGNRTVGSNPTLSASHSLAHASSSDSTTGGFPSRGGIPLRAAYAVPFRDAVRDIFVGSPTLCSRVAETR